jgi:hypothetical protein
MLYIRHFFRQYILQNIDEYIQIFTLFLGESAHGALYDRRLLRHLFLSEHCVLLWPAAATLLRSKRRIPGGLAKA